jgi:hypothetical protein
VGHRGPSDARGFIFEITGMCVRQVLFGQIAHGLRNFE